MGSLCVSDDPCKWEQEEEEFAECGMEKARTAENVHQSVVDLQHNTWTNAAAMQWKKAPVEGGMQFQSAWQNIAPESK